MNRRRRRRPSVYGGKKIQMNFLPVIVIICLSVFAGYLTAKYVVCPILGYEPAGLSVLQKENSIKTEEKKKDASEAAKVPEETSETAREPSGKTAVIEDQIQVKKTSGYALQFGSYSTKEAAQKSVEDLKSSGIEAKVIEKDGAYKVIGEIFDTKEKAKEDLSKLDKSVGAFVTSIEK